MVSEKELTRLAKSILQHVTISDVQDINGHSEVQVSIDNGRNLTIHRCSPDKSGDTLADDLLALHEYLKREPKQAVIVKHRHALGE